MENTILAKKNMGTISDIFGPFEGSEALTQ